MIATSLYCLPADVLGEGAETVLTNVVKRAGVAGVTVAASYHASRDVYPHNPLHRVARVAPGAFYQPSQLMYGDSVLRPIRSASADGRDILEEVCHVSVALGIEASAWLVLLHRDEWTPPEMLQVNCFGDRVPGALCPARPEVQEYVLRVVGEVCSYPIRTLRVESLHYHGLAHGGHHERCADNLGQMATFLLGVCWCESCLERAHAEGVDGEGLAARCKGYLSGVFDGRVPSPMATGSRLMTAVGAQMMKYIAVRGRTVTDLAGQVALRARQCGVQVAFIDQTFMMGLPAVGQKVSRVMARAAWELGIDWGGLVAADVGIEALVYVAGVEEVEAGIEWYKGEVREGGRLSIVLQPGERDLRSANELGRKIAYAIAAGCVEVNFYAYGLYRLGALDLIRSALREADAV